MFNMLGSRPHGRREEALLIATFITAFLFFSIFAVTYNQYEGKLTLGPNSFKTIAIKGHSWGTISISIHSSSPVTVCITDETGVRLLSSGQNALCYFYQPQTKEVKAFWRFPSTGTYYLVVLAGNGGAEVRVKLTVGIAAI